MSTLHEMAAAFHQARTAPDALDRATGLEEADRIGGVALVQARLQGQGRPDCLDCGEDILPARRQAVTNAVRCKECQDDHDKREARRHG
ncbi:TraR/DksA family transcriptional regulator [Stutzerimonas stutzeri]|uniref:TraR/DksA C4-type zinc finger protein n=1 Tax=Stutzerimonas stutzeri TaxID=316 RepID=UPI000F7B504E|nr:TraR/DksA C4-type zinc finger protein [Stutzerimonas stutzeri]RRV38645.1 TraR/DksA family transcriptional regulator [Stutzerimonas stutzeri]RRV38708.1 TraR/DksA family transcriptional regulator [Stutzerimonas stutzeri]